MTVHEIRVGRPLSIIHAIASVAPRYGGPSAAIPGMAQALATRGHHVEVVTTNIDGPGELDVPIGEPIETGGYSITYWRSQLLRSYAFSLPLGRDVLRRVGSADIVHIHGLFQFPGLVAGGAARRSGTAYIVRPHGHLDPYHRSHGRVKKAVYWRLWERRNLDHAAALHFTSGAERDHAEALGLRAPAVVVPLGVSTPTMGVAEAAGIVEAAWPETVGKRIVAFLGRLTAKKRVPLLLEAFAILNSADTHLVIAGPDNDGLLDSYLRQATGLGIRSRCTFPGAVEGNLKEALLAKSSAFVLASVDENMGVAVLEAMAHSVPVVVTTGVALHGDIESFGAGVVVTPDPRSLAQGIGIIINDSSRGLAMGSAGSNLVRRCYSWRAVGQELESMYYDAVARARSRKSPRSAS